MDLIVNGRSLFPHAGQSQLIHLFNLTYSKKYHKILSSLQADLFKPHKHHSFAIELNFHLQTATTAYLVETWVFDL